MARPRIFDYDAASDETIVTEGVEGAVLTWFGMDIDNQVIHIVCSEGTINATGDGIEDVTRSGQQETLDATDTVTFYQANKTEIDSIISAALETWAARRSKTGDVVES
jgi:hypothetical protein